MDRERHNTHQIMVCEISTKSEEELEEGEINFDDKVIEDRRNQIAREPSKSDSGNKASHEESVIVKDYNEIDKYISVTKPNGIESNGKVKEKEVVNVVSDDELKNMNVLTTVQDEPNISFFHQVKLQFCFDDFTYCFVFCFIPSIMDFYTDFSFGASFATENDSLAAGVIYAIIILPSCQLLVDVLFKLFLICIWREWSCVRTLSSW